MSISYQRAEVVKLSSVWKRIRAVLSGPKSVKDGDTLYLPMPNPEDSSEENKKRYQSYKKRAVFYAAAARTHKGLLGQVFYKDPTIELPPLLQPLLLSVDGGELTLEQQAHDAVGECLALGHGGILTDYPSTQRAATRMEQRLGKVRPTLVLYKAEQIINWRFMTTGARRMLSLLVLKEEFDSEDDGYEIKRATQYREFRMEQLEGRLILRCKIHRQGKQGWEVVEDYYPKKGNGQNWDEIPFSPFGAESNDPFPDDPPMEDLVEINLGHYRNSADYEESVFMVGQPTPWGSGLDESWITEVWKGTLMLGSRAFLPLPKGGQAGLLQPEPNVMAKEAMEHKEKLMVSLGAKLVEQRSVQRTATETMSDSVVDNSILSTVAKNVSAAYRRAIELAMVYGNISGKFEFELNTDYEISKLTAQERQQLLAEWQGGGITWDEYRWNMKRSGVAYEDDAKAKQKIDREMADSVDLPDIEGEENGDTE